MTVEKAFAILKEFENFSLLSKFLLENNIQEIINKISNIQFKEKTRMGPKIAVDLVNHFFNTEYQVSAKGILKK